MNITQRGQSKFSILLSETSNGLFDQYSINHFHQEDRSLLDIWVKYSRNLLFEDYSIQNVDIWRSSIMRIGFQHSSGRLQMKSNAFQKIHEGLSLNTNRKQILICFLCFSSRRRFDFSNNEFNRFRFSFQRIDQFETFGNNRSTFNRRRFLSNCQHSESNSDETFIRSTMFVFGFLSLSTNSPRTESNGTQRFNSSVLFDFVSRSDRTGRKSLPFQQTN